MASYVKQVFTSSKNGKIDLAVPFIEQGVRLLNEHGRLGYIVQKRFFKTDYGKGIRKLLTAGHLLNGIYDYEETDLFANRITYVAILVLLLGSYCFNTASGNALLQQQRKKIC